MQKHNHALSTAQARVRATADQLSSLAEGGPQGPMQTS